MSIVVKEYLEIDSRSLTLAQRPSPPISGQSAHRYIHNPLRNFIYEVLTTPITPITPITEEVKENSDNSKILSLANANLLLPECDICGYLSTPTAQYFTSTYLSKAEAKIGIVKGLKTDDISQVEFLDCTKNPTFSSINVYLSYDLCNFPEYFTQNMQERYDKLYNVVKTLSDENYATTITETTDNDLSETSQ